MAVYSVSLMDSGHLPKFRRRNPRALFALIGTVFNMLSPFPDLLTRFPPNDH